MGAIWINAIGPHTSITITEPKYGFVTDQSSVILKGYISPPTAVLKINGALAVILDNVTVLSDVDYEGNFSYQLMLGDTPESTQVENKFIISADDYSTIFKVIRSFTEEEVANYQAKIQREQDRIQAKAEAELKAEQAAWESSRAGRLCKTHPDWLKSECQRVADNKYWIGMTLDMLKAERGTPNSANPSNYGRGREWQWCWHRYTPSCFYGGEDGIVDSYN